MLLSERKWVFSLLICSAPFAADVLPDLPKFGEVYSEENSSWQGEFLIAGGSNVGHAHNSHFSLTQPSVIVEGNGKSMGKHELLAGSMLLHYTTFHSKLEPYWAAPIKAAPDNLESRKHKQTFALSIVYFTKFVKDLAWVVDVCLSQLNSDSDSYNLPANYPVKLKLNCCSLPSVLIS